jgi:hypothetical protein
MATEGKYMRQAKIVIDDTVTEQTCSFKHLRCNISIYKMNMDLEDNVQKYNKLNGCIKRCLGKNMRKEIKLKLRNIVSKPALQYGSETWVLKSRRQKENRNSGNEISEICVGCFTKR